jgi:hypothetical protein
LLTAIDQAFNPVSKTVEGAIEGTGPAVVALAWDRDPDAMLTGILPNLPAAVAFVSDDAMRAALGESCAPPLHSTGLQKRLEDRRLVLLPRGQDERQQLTTSFRSEMDFGTEPTPAAAEGFGRWVPFFAPAAC